MKFLDEEINQIVNNEKNYGLIGRLKEYDIVDRYVIDYSEINQKYELVANITSMGKFYRTMIRWDKAMKVSDYQCSCQYCTVESACAHVGVLMESVNEAQPTVFPYYFENEKFSRHEDYVRKRVVRHQMEASQQFIDQQKETAFEFDPDGSKPIEMQLLLKPKENYGPQDEYLIGFKIGYRRMYMVKSIKKFLRSVLLETYQSYGKDFSTYHQQEKFDAQTQLVLQFMRDMWVIQEDELEYNSKDFILNDETIDLFYQQASKIESLTNIHFENLDLSEQKIQLEIKQEEDTIEIGLIEDRQFIVGQKAFYHIIPSSLPGKEYTCIRYNFNQNLQIKDFYQHVRYNPFVLDPESYQTFDRFVLHPMQDYIEASGVDISPLLLDNRRELYGDFGNEDDIVFTVKAYVDEVLLNQSFREKDSSSVSFLKLIEIIKYYGGFVSEDGQAVSFDLGQSTTMDFLQEGLHVINPLATIFVSEALKRLSAQTHRKFRIGLTFKNNLLEIDLDQEDIPKEELKEVLLAYKRKKKFYRLKNGETVVLNEQDFEAVNGLLDQMGYGIEEIEDGTLWVNPYRIFALDALGENQLNFEVSKSDSFQQHLEAIQTIDPSKIALPSGINAELRTYQVTGYQWLKTLHNYGFGGILADDMGLGKTLQMITYFASAEKGNLHLVVCPSSVLLNWEQEIKKFTSSLNVMVMTGTKQERLEILSDLKGVDVLLTSYDYLRRDIDVLKELEFETVVLDEAQYIKNHQSQNSKSVKKLRAQQRFALTGTPIENSLAELWSIFDFLMPGYLYKYSYFKEHYESAIVKENDIVVSRQLKRLVQPFILRRLKGDVLTDLPEKTETNMIIEFTEEEKKLYYANLAEVNQELQQAANVAPVSDIQVLAMLTRLRRICCEPRTIYDNIQTPSSKTEAVLNFLQDLKADGKQTLLFSSFTSVLDLLAISLDQMGIRYRMIDGRVDKVKRQEHIQDFQNGEVDVFLISLRAGGTGINLTAAEVVIHFDPWWNVSAQNQATDRAYRIGQLNHVFVYKFIMKGSIEEKIQELQAKKKALADTFIEDSDGSISVLDKSEIISLFSIDN